MIRRLAFAFVPITLAAAVLAAQEEPARPAKDDPEGQKAPDDKKGDLPPIKELDKLEKKKPPAKKDDLPPIKELEKREPRPDVPPGGGEDAGRIKKIIERLHNNMDSSEERLKKTDPGDDTRKIQDEIIKDLDELIKQQGKGGGGGGGGGGMAGGSGGGGGGGSASASGKGSRSAFRNKNSAKRGEKNLPDKLGADKDGGKGGGQTANGNPENGAQDKSGLGKDGKGGGGGGTNQKRDEKSTLADLFKDVWGHLPQNKRQEMDAYAKERFLQKYEEILRQYYRTISEQDRRKGD